MHEYKAEDLRVITDREHVRARPAMYIGSVGPRGVNHLIMELIDNVADQFLAGAARQVDVQIDDRLISVSDDGPGLQFDTPSAKVDSLATQYWTSIHRQPTADDHSPHVHFCGYGCGQFVVNALSEHLLVRSCRRGQRWQQTFSRGAATENAHVIEGDTTPGTSILFSPDAGIFGDALPDMNWLEKRLKTVSHLLPNFSLTLQEQSFYSPGGLADWAAELIGQPTTKPLWINCSVRDYSFQAAMAGTTNGKTDWRTFVNGNEMIDGSQLDAFKSLLEHANWTPAVAMLHVTMMSPQFAGPTRSTLQDHKIFAPMKQGLENAIEEYCQSSGIGRHAT